jgi:hypothetical protein
MTTKETLINSSFPRRRDRQRQRPSQSICLIFLDPCLRGDEKNVKNQRFPNC